MTLALCVCVECIGSLSLTKPTMQQRFHPSAKHFLYKYNTPSFVGLFVLKVKLVQYFFANSPLCILI